MQSMRRLLLKSLYENDYVWKIERALAPNEMRTKS